MRWLRNTQQRPRGPASRSEKYVLLRIKMLRRLRAQFDALASPLLKARGSRSSAG